MKVRTTKNAGKVKRAVPDSATRVRVLLVDDHPLIRMAIKEILRDQKDMEICGEASDEASATALVKTTHPSLMLLDLSLAGAGSGLELIKRLTTADPSLHILILSMHDESLYAERAIRAGAHGYVNKREAPVTLITAIRSVLQGKIYLSSDMANRMLHRISGRESDAGLPDTARLSDREMETFELIGQGMQTQKIADQLCISVKAIEVYRQRIKEKLGLSSSTELMRRAVEWVLLRS